MAGATARLALLALVCLTGLGHGLRSVRRPAGRAWCPPQRRLPWQRMASSDGFTEVELKQLLEDLERNSDGKPMEDLGVTGDRAEQLAAAVAEETSDEAEGAAATAMPPPPSPADEADTTRTSPGTEKSPGQDFADFVLPAFDIESLGLSGDWEDIGGNLVLRPPEGQEARAVVHFLGGAFVGATPSLAYRYLLKRLAAEGFVIVATPYKLEFDYLSICDAVIERFDAAALPLAQEYGAIPVVGVGHSCGALLQSLITSLFPETPRVGNVLISWNNRPAAEAVPGFETTIIPLSKALFAESRAAKDLRKRIAQTRRRSFMFVESALKQGLLPTVWRKELYPLVCQADDAISQLPSLLKEVAEGKREFTPDPSQTRILLRKLYRARRTLVLGFDDDTIDESEVVVSCLRESTSVWRMKRPMISVEMDVATLTGTHVTPLSQNVVPEQVIRKEQRQLGLLEDVEGATDLILSWLEETLGAAKV
eukprot:CAMPEP_0118867394 /NCGR_PEP_ID=MMETSP1163-20130328/11013_1 /TAXON_ID=124430 /ORGANISM="Phaeomonas parva, Strain CCMP2877" /LENGTH=480 /DNA_ID=CAMNT_0006801803 /DNA_START=79 /DNA_END=1521 /DNA_ORIENTATION=-